MENTTDPAPLMPVPPPKDGKNKVIASLVLVIVLLLAGGALAYWKQKQGSPTSGGTKEQDALNLPTPTDFFSPSSTPTSTGSYTNSFDATNCQNSLPPVTSKSGAVQWVTPQKIEGLKLLDALTQDYNFMGDDSYTVGHILSGKYKGGDVLLTIASFEGMGYDEDFYHVIKYQNNYFILGQFLNTDYHKVTTKAGVSLDKDYVLPDFDFPPTLSSQNPTASYTQSPNLGFFRGNTTKFCADHLVKAFNDTNAGVVYADTDATGTPGSPDFYNPLYAFYVKAPDGTQRVYQLDVNIVGSDKIPLVTWSNGESNTQQYSFLGIAGCGASKFRDVVNVTYKDLKIVGMTLNNTPVYGYADSGNQDLKDTYDGMYVPEGKTKISYDKFIASHPIFFWQDPYGKFVRFKSMEYQPMAECGKPVIYLYPQTTEKVSVKLSPVGGFTYSEPAYNQGWEVIADPNGNLTNISDGKNYPYLFWEGRGGLYQTPDKGFVVEQANVHEFLNVKLQELGLNKGESKDFLEFWEPKMQGSPYYFVTFMGNRVMDDIAPLSITPKPDTVIRVLMDFIPLEHPISVEAYQIHTPERKGFTVVEWGGVLRGKGGK